jgi:hypothetical protein
MVGRPDRVERRQVYEGSRVTVVAAVSKNGRCPTLDFLDGLSRPDAAKLYAMFRRFADTGLIQDGQKFKRLDGDVWEFKARGRDTGLRVTCYRDGRLLILLTGFLKKEDDAPPREVALAARVMGEDRRLHANAP